MRVKRTATLLQVIVIASYVLLLPQKALACDCLAPSGKEALEGADAAFSGKVTEVEYLDADEPRVEPRIIVTFEVYRLWKGPLSKSAVVHTIYNKWTCKGYYFKAGEEYLVFAYKNDEQMAERFSTAKDTLGVNPCGATRSLAHAEEELGELGPGHMPE